MNYNKRLIAIFFPLVFIVLSIQSNNSKTFYLPTDTVNLILSKLKKKNIIEEAKAYIYIKGVSTINQKNLLILLLPDEICPIQEDGTIYSQSLYKAHYT